MKPLILILFVIGTALAQNQTDAPATSAQESTSDASISQTTQAPQLPAVVQFLGQVVRGQVLGLKKCKKPRDCGLGLRCDAMMNLCVPFNTPLLSDIEKPCMNQSECSPLHQCQFGFCRFCGPKMCRSNMDCCMGSMQPGQPSHMYECLNLEHLEKQSIARQLGRPVITHMMPGGKSPEDAIESDELITLGISQHGDRAFYGKRCWHRCNNDNECYGAHTPEEVKAGVGCCNGVCTRKQSCVAVPQSAIQLQQQQQLLASQHQQHLMQQQQAMLQQQQQLQMQVPQAAGQVGVSGQQQG